MLNIIDNKSVINQNTCVCLGKFDGIHKGHQKIINTCVSQSNNILTPTVFTFDDNPKLYLSSKCPPKKLMTNSLKYQFFSNMGIQYLYSPKFTDIMNLSPADFIDKILVDFLHTKKFICGDNFYFGKNAEGNINTLKSLCKDKNIEVIIVDKVLEHNNIISSQNIRKLLLDGNIDKANDFLGHYFCYNFIVQHGNKLGRTIGIPTINQIFKERYLIPKRGVYASFVEFSNKKYYSVTNIGIKPTVGGTTPLSETWIPQYNSGLLYGAKVKVSLIGYLREEKKFDNLNMLKSQIEYDAEKSKSIFDIIKNKVL